jgi:hypothetical protein
MRTMIRPGFLNANLESEPAYRAENVNSSQVMQISK